MIGFKLALLLYFAVLSSLVPWYYVLEAEGLQFLSIFAEFAQFRLWSAPMAAVSGESMSFLSINDSPENQTNFYVSLEKMCRLPVPQNAVQMLR